MKICLKFSFILVSSPWDCAAVRRGGVVEICSGQLKRPCTRTTVPNIPSYSYCIMGIFPDTTRTLKQIEKAAAHANPPFKILNMNIIYSFCFICLTWMVCVHRNQRLVMTLNEY